MQATTTTCDACGARLGEGGGTVRYHLALGCELSPVSGAVLAVHVIPPLDRTHHFCDLACLVIWLEERKR